MEVKIGMLTSRKIQSDLAKFIAAGRIPCTIDRVTGKGVIDKQGDQLITKLQKYGQAVRLRGSERA